MNDNLYNKLCSILKRGPWRKPIDVIHSFVDCHLINVFEIQEYLNKYKKEEKKNED